MSYRVNVGYYLDTYDTLLPEDTDVVSIADSLWYTYLKGKFDNEVWANFYDRELFDNRKFNNSDEDDNYDNIIKTIKIRLINRQRIYERMFNAFVADFNPLWNVDGVTGTIRESSHKGTVTNTGKTDTTNTGQTDTTHTGETETTKTGKTDTTNTGQHSNTKSGNQTNTPTGTEIDKNYNTTFDSSTYRDVSKTEKSFVTRTDTTTFNNVKDEYKIDAQNPLKESYEIDDDNPLKDKYKIDAQNPLKDTYKIDAQNPLKTSYKIDDQNPLKEQRNLTDNDLEMVIRQGNIGITRNDELITHALELFDSSLYDWVRYVTNDLISQVTYSIY